MPLNSTESFSRLQRSYEAAAFASLEAKQDEYDAFMEALEQCETLDDLHRVFGDAVKRCRNDSDVFDYYTIDGYDIAVCEDCGRLVAMDEATDQCPHCGYSQESDDF